ncbi:hypothetical protein DFH08DRAFT_1088257 [Mycena albidolilacea]|uniref:DUF6534 domain-containing protein n=1 Tax=Mycena albidolilacea TaxID=1033008 RepID=A0AAD7EB87_9AGAR|nr:hypothetical protein DFH08DRAFT_1088257 [Mycena albidolilacea]
MPLPALDTITGCLLIATWASSLSRGFSVYPQVTPVGKLLYISEVYQGLYDFRHFKKDDWKLKALVTVALLVNTVSTVGEYSGVYLASYTITHAGDLEYLSNAHWLLPLLSSDIGASNSSTQNSLISLILSPGIIITLCSKVASSCIITLYPSFKDRLKLKIVGPLWLVTEVAVDAGITSALLWEFRKARGIISILDRLTAVTIQSGAAAATLAGAAVISYYIVPKSNLDAGFLFPLGRVYAITLLANLNIRKSGKSLSTTAVSSGPGTSSGAQRPLTLTSWNIDDSCGIHVHRTVHTSVQVVGVEDPRQPHAPGTFKHPLPSAAINSSPEDIEMAVSTKQQTLFAA